MMKKILFSMVFPCLLASCGSLSDKIGGVFPKKPNAANSENSIKLVSGVYRQSNSHWGQNRGAQSNVKTINHYARGIMQELVSNLQYVGSRTPVAVADFVYLNSDFNETNIIGQQLAEALTHEVHKLGIPVVDYKVTGYIRVTANGSFAFSRDFLELSGEIPIRYILTGTLIESAGGVMVNARVVGVESKAVVASAQGVIPMSIVRDLNVGFINDGLPRS